MQTTLRIDDDLLIAVKEIAQRESKTAGAVVSDLLRQSLVRAKGADRQGRVESPGAEFGFRPFPKRRSIVSNDVIDRLREKGVATDAGLEGLSKQT